MNEKNRFSVLQVMESWVGPGNEAKLDRSLKKGLLLDLLLPDSYVRLEKKLCCHPSVSRLACRVR